MSNIALVQSAIVTAFNVLGDLVGTFTLKRSTNVFNPATSEVTATASTFVCQGVFDNEKNKYLPLTELAKGTTRVWLKCSTEPKLSDILVLPNAEERSIIEIKPVQANTTIFIYEVILGA
jgi:hypothetical protein